MSVLVEGPVGPRRKPWRAAVLGFVWPGVGHLYAGRGSLAFSLLLLFPPVEGGISLLAVVVPVPLANVLIPVVLIAALRVYLARGAARAASAFNADRPVPLFSRWYSCLTAVVLTVVLNAAWGHVYRTTFVRTCGVTGESMEPTILLGDRLLAVQWAYGWREPVLDRVIFGARRPKRGELVVFRYPKDRSVLFVKRLIGLPGETVEMRDRKILINGAPLDEPYAQFVQSASMRSSWGPQIVPVAGYFVLGDNRDASVDSRYWGSVPQDDLLGRAAVVYWSSDPRQGRIRWDRIGRGLE